MNIGYACLAIAVPNSGMKSCRLSNATTDHLLSLIEHNLNALETLIDYNIRNGISLFRISSDVIPFGSGVAAELRWEEIFSDKFDCLSEKINQSGMRVSMHPGQYTVLNSPHEAVVNRAIDDLSYHTRFLDALSSESKHKLILHLGGAYGDKEAAKRRFVDKYQRLDTKIKRRLVLENDDSLFTIADILGIATEINAPVVYDNLHNLINPADLSMTDRDWISRTAVTWHEVDGPQKIHYSQQNPDKRAGAHSETIDHVIFSAFISTLPHTDIDIMLEVKDKNISALKCLNTSEDRGILRLEQEWARYKYSVLERSAVNYTAIRQLLRDKDSYPASEMYQLIDLAEAIPQTIGAAVNALQHVWGYFKQVASSSEKRRFDKLLAAYTRGEGTLRSVKKHLLGLAEKYKQDYLLNAYYFYQ